MGCPVNWIKAKFQNKKYAMMWWGYFVILKKAQKQENRDWRGFQMNSILIYRNEVAFLVGVTRQIPRGDLSHSISARKDPRFCPKGPEV